MACRTVSYAAIAVSWALVTYELTNAAAASDLEVKSGFGRAACSGRAIADRAPRAKQDLLRREMEAATRPFLVRDLRAWEAPGRPRYGVTRV